MPSTSGGISNSKVVPSSVLPASQNAYALDEHEAKHNKKRATIAEVTPLNPETLLNWSSSSSPAHQRSFSCHTYHLPQSIVNLNYNFYHHYHHRDSPRNNFSSSPSRDDMSFNYHPLLQETVPSTPSINFSQSTLVNALMTSPKKYYTNPSSSPQKHHKNVSSSRGSVNGGDSGSIELEWDDYDQTQIKDEFDFIDDDDNYRERRRGDSHHHETEVSVIDPLRRSPVEPENSITKL